MTKKKIAIKKEILDQRRLDMIKLINKTKDVIIRMSNK
jgi:hypothetical protein